MPVINILIRGSLCFLFVFLPLHSLDNWFYDHAFQVRGAEESESQIALVRIDDAKLHRFTPEVNHLYPTPPVDLYNPHPVWHSAVYGKVLDQIQAQDPKLVLITTFFGSVDTAKANPRMRTKMVLSARIDEENKLVLPSHSLRPENYGFNNLFPDADSVIRKARLAHSTSPSLALQAYYQTKGFEIERSRDLLKPMWINYRGPAYSYTTFDASEILEGKSNLNKLKGKIVLLGRDSSEYSDLETPFGRMARLEVQANIAETVLLGQEIRQAPAWVNYLVASMIIIFCVIIILKLPLKMGWISLLGLCFLLLVVTFILLFYGRLWIGVANPIVCIFGTHLLMLGFKLGRQEEVQWRIEQESKQLREMDQFKNNFISLFSHDLKTPISKIKAVIARTKTENPDLSPAIHQSFSMLEQTTDELARKISDILKVTKMETMALELNKGVLDLNRIIDEEVKKLCFIAKEKGVEIIRDLEPLFSIEGDEILVREIVMNLIENAIKYSPPELKVVVSTKEENEKVYVTVSDEGDGIPPEEIPRVTGKFYRGRTHSQQTKGSGLGLYLTKYFVELHGGKLEIESEVRKGTQVSFWLPIPA